MRGALIKSQMYAFLTVVFWSSAYVFTKTALEFFSVSSLAVLRCLVASLSLAGVAAFGKMPPPPLSAIPRFLLTGAAGFAFYVLAFNKGSVLLNPTTSCVIISTAPIITALLAYFRFGEKVGAPGVLAMGAAFGGILVMMLWNGVMDFSEGIVWIFGAALLISIYNILQRDLARRYGALHVTTYSFVAGTILLLPFLPEAAVEWSNAPLGQQALVCFLGVCPSAAAYLLWSKAMAIAPRTGGVANYMFLTPFFALLLEYAVTGDVPGPETFVGGGVILASLAVFAVSRRS